MLEVKNLTKKYGDLTAVNDISFNINSGEIVGLLGPNGAGKSTTIKCIIGLLRKNQGNILINGHDNKSKKAKENFAYIPEMPQLYDRLTVWEHFRFVAQAYKIKDFEERALQLMERFDLTDKKDDLSKELSKGMKQKVSIISALIIDPELYLFDEPMIGLDPKAIRETKLIFSELADAGKSVFISTHLLDSIEKICNKILVMKDGHIIARGSLDELRTQLSKDKNMTLEEVFLEVTK